MRFRLGFVAALVLAACGGSPAMRAAERGDLASLRAEIGAREKAGDLSNGEAAKVAHAVAEHELMSARGDEAPKRVRESLACADELDGVLEERAKTHDLAGAEAAMALADDGKTLHRGAVRAFLDDKDDAWRAVGARGLVREEDRDARKKAMLDPSPLVRRAAMRAAVDAKDASDFDALLEAARLDPDAMVRTEGLRAAECSADPARAPALVGRLRDLWPAADDAIREDIAVAYALPAIYAAGGREALTVLVGAENGPGAIAGAGAIARSSHADKVLVDSAVGLLARTIEDGTRRDRMHAIAVAPMIAAPVKKSLEKAARADEGDAQVRVAALATLTQDPASRAASIAALESVAGGEDEKLASRARLALAHAKDVRIQAWIEKDLSASDPFVRLSAADALAALGRSARGAPLLADADASVRTRAACTLMMAARR
jgi:hypothetical protein